MTTPDYDREHYDWLVGELLNDFDKLDETFLDVLKRLHSFDKGEPISEYARMELEHHADKYAKEIIKTYQLIHSQLDTSDYEYKWIHSGMLSIVVEIRNPAGDRDAVMWQLEQHVTHWHELVRYNTIHKLKFMATHSNHRARQILWNARTKFLLNEEETKTFRKLIYDALNEIDKN